MHDRHFEFYDVAAHFNPERQIGGRLLQPIVGNAFDMGEEVHRDLVTLDRRLNPGAFWRMVVGPRYENLPADRIGELLSCSSLPEIVEEAGRGSGGGGRGQ